MAASLMPAWATEEPCPKQNKTNLTGLSPRSVSATCPIPRQGDSCQHPGPPGSVVKAPGRHFLHTHTRDSPEKFHTVVHTPLTSTQASPADQGSHWRGDRGGRSLQEGDFSKVILPSGYLSALGLSVWKLQAGAWHLVLWVGLGRG